MVNYQFHELAFSNQRDFLKSGPALLERLSVDAKPLWGIMTPQHMVEHLEEWLEIALKDIEAPDEGEHDFENMQNFLWSENPFPPNIPTPGLPEGQLPTLRHENLAESIHAFSRTLNSFLLHFDQADETSAFHPVFGYLNAKGWLQYQEKHFRHHMGQFGLL